jgi:hypothetical protein
MTTEEGMTAQNKKAGLRVQTGPLLRRCVTRR